MSPILSNVNTNNIYIKTKQSLNMCETNGNNSDIAVNINTHLLTSVEQPIPEKRRPGRPRKKLVVVENSHFIEDIAERSLSEQEEDTPISKRSSRKIRKPQKFADYELNLSKLSGKVRTDSIRKSTELRYIDNIKVPEFTLEQIEILNNPVQDTKCISKSKSANIFITTSESDISKEENTFEATKPQNEIVVAEIDSALSSSLFVGCPAIKTVESELPTSISLTQTPKTISANPLASLTDEGLIVIEPDEGEMQFVMQPSPPLKDEESYKARRRKKNIELLDSSQDVSRFIISRTDRTIGDDDSEGQMHSKSKAKCLAAYVQEQGIVRDGLVECKICGKSLKLCSFKQHLRTHEGVKPFECGICGSCFTRKGDAERHIRVVHKQENLYTCSKCGRNFQDKKNLRWHLLNHDKKMVYKCEYCGFKFGKKEYYDNHVKYIHELGILEGSSDLAASKLSCQHSSNQSNDVLSEDVKLSHTEVMVPYSISNHDEEKSIPDLITSGQTSDAVLPGRMFQMGTDELDAAALVRELESVIGQDQNSVIVVNEADLSKVLILNSNQIDCTKNDSVSSLLNKDIGNVTCRPNIRSESKQEVLNMVEWPQRSENDTELCLQLSDGKTSDNEHSEVDIDSKQSHIVRFLDDSRDSVKNLFHMPISKNNELVSDNLSPDNSQAILLQTGEGEFKQFLMSKDGSTMLLIADGKAVPIQNLISEDGQAVRVIMETSDGHAQLYEVEELSTEGSSMLSLVDSETLAKE